jgi:AcrR family transcriptional regulator
MPRVTTDESGTAAEAPADPRTRILTAARQVFSAKGFWGGTLNEVAVTAGLTRAGLLHYYPSKEHVLIALLEDRDRWVREAAPDRAATVTMIEYLDAEVADVLPALLEERQLMQLAHMMTAEAAGEQHPAHDWVAARYEAIRERLAECVRNSITEGDAPPGIDPDSTAAAMLGTLEGLENQWLVDPDAVDVAHALSQLRILLIAARPD